ncbi:MAG TPA: trypsin-like serine protease [Labilithrix sp.]
MRPATRRALMNGLRLLLLPFAVLACSAPSSEEQVRATSSAIVGGDASPSTHDAVVFIGNPVDHTVCTGTLVAPDVVVTARHCVSRMKDETASGACKSDGTHGGDPNAQELAADYKASDLDVFVGPSTPKLTKTLMPAAIGKTIVHDDATSICNHDVAFLVLDRAVTAPIAKLRTTPPVAGEKLTLVGYGDDVTGGLPAARQERSVDVLVVGPYDSPGGGGLAPAELLVSEGGCYGDSGGPTLDDSGDIVSIDSRGASAGKGPSGCEGANEVHTSVASFGALATRALAIAIGVPTDAGADADAPDPAPDPPEADAPTTTSSSCSAGARSGSSFGGAIVAAVIAAAARRRRRLRSEQR